MVGPECEREKVIQQFKENGLQEVIISLSEGGDEDVEKKTQEHLKSMKDQPWPQPEV